MSYNDVVEMKNSPRLKERTIAAAATQEGISNPEGAVDNYWWKIVASPGWSEAWAYYRTANPEDESDVGANSGVITDGMILSAVQAVIPT